MGKRLQAYKDGFATTGDIVGTAIGYITKNKAYIGYFADRFSLENDYLILLESPLQAMGQQTNLEPKKRDLEDIPIY